MIIIIMIIIIFFKDASIFRLLLYSAINISSVELFILTNKENIHIYTRVVTDTLMSTFYECLMEKLAKLHVINQMSRIMRKPMVSICENKDTDQL